MRKIFSPKLVLIYIVVLFVLLTLESINFMAIMYTGGRSIPIEQSVTGTTTYQVIEESKPLYPNVKYINDIYLRSLNIFLEKNDLAYPFLLFVITPGLYLLSLIGLIFNFIKTKSKIKKILLFTIACLVLAPLLYLITIRNKPTISFQEQMKAAKWVEHKDTYLDYIHRIGRTGRNNKKGIALSFVD